MKTMEGKISRVLENGVFKLDMFNEISVNVGDYNWCIAKNRLGELKSYVLRDDYLISMWDAADGDRQLYSDVFGVTNVF